ncbi:MAG: choice-of-anchor D domain-containing protein, partial [Phycisphaerae bacterium]|nr:choice-of-anchor D domain-containing protein [Phycisphaerae bacterium]
LLSQPRSPLGRGKSTKFKVRLNPASAGETPTGALTIASNSLENELFEIDLTASVNVVTPALSVTGPGGSITNGGTVTLDPTNLNQPIQTTITIGNPGTATLTIGGVSVVGTGYTLSRAPAASIEPGRTTTLVVRLVSAVLLDPAIGTVSFTSNAPGASSFSFTLAGAVRVVPPSPEVEVLETLIGPGGSPTMQVIPVGSSRNYGTISAGNSVIRTYTIRNRGTGPLALSGLMLNNTMGSAFSILSGGVLPASLAAGASTTFSIQFLPAAAGSFNAGVAFINDDPDDGENPFTFSVTGIATAANIAFDVAYRGFGTVVMARLPNPLPPIGSRPYPFSLGAIPAGGSTVLHDGPQDSFVITNRGNSPLIVSGATVTDPVPPSPIVWLGDLNPQPCFPDPCPTPPLGQVSLLITHNGLVPGPSRGLVTLTIADGTGAPLVALSPWQFEVQEWVNDWFITNGGLGGGAVRAFTTFDPDGSDPTLSPAIFAAGAFTAPGGSPRIATLNAGSWTALPGGGINTVGASVNALAVYDEPNDSNPPVLFAGGTTFNSVGAPAITGINNIAKWNGATWAPVGTIATNGVTGGSINAMVVYGASTPPTDPPSQLYVGGSFTGAAGVGAVQGIARWNGTAWNRIRTTDDGILGGEIRAMAVFDTDGSGPNPAELYVGGNFTNLSSLIIAANGIARFNGTSWNTMGIAPNTGVTGAGARVNAMVVFDSDGPEGAANPTLVVGGSFTSAGNLVVNSIAQWTGTAWQPFNTGGIGAAPNEIFALAVFDEDAFHPEDNDGDTDNDPTNGTRGLKRRTQAGRLYAAGNFSFTLPSGSPVNNIARWNASVQQWEPVGSDVSNGTNGEVRALHAFDPDGLLTAGAPNNPEQLFVGGLFTNVIQLAPDPDVTLPINNVAVWSATAP